MAICAGYLRWLSTRAGASYRLPTEAEWEYAARAGTETAYWWGDQAGSGRANCNGCGSEWDNRRIAPVGRFEPNPWGLHDSVGNVWEWTSVRPGKVPSTAVSRAAQMLVTPGGSRALRGGSWNNETDWLHSYSRNRNNTDNRNNNVGLRVLRAASPPGLPESVRPRVGQSVLPGVHDPSSGHRRVGNAK